MMKTTVYLPPEMKDRLKRLAAAEGRSEADLIREAIKERVGRSSRRPPRLPLTDRPLGDPSIARQVDDLLADGFGR